MDKSTDTILDDDVIVDSDTSKIMTININDVLSSVEIDTILGSTGSFTISANGAVGSNYSYGTYTGPSGPYYYSTAPYITTAPNTGGNWGTINTTNTPGLKVQADAEFDGDIKWKGRSLSKWLEDVEKRLAILVPDPEKLEHFEALKKAYEHYKTLEALCELPKKTKE